MNTPKRAGIATAAIAFVLWLTAPALAQGVGKDLKNSTPEDRAKFQSGTMITRLKLDSVQANKVRAINLNYANKFQAVLKSDDRRMSKFRQVKNLQEAKDNELKAVFTEAQFKQYQEFEQAMKNQFMQRAGKQNSY
ncbi:MAG TPA: hypothetical protein VIM77_08520 [Mucilaginibacter sp.]